MADSLTSQPKELVWLITGTSSGFGKRLVSSALGRGDRVIATSRSMESLESAHGTAVADDKLHLMELDVTSGFDTISRVIEDAIKVWGRIDVLVNNAGIGLLGLLEESGSSMARRQFDTNVFGLLDVTNAILPHMRSRKEGTIVMFGSRSVWRSETPGLGTYAASKSAVHALTISLAAEVAALNIRVLLLAPGAFRTEGMYAYGFQTKRTFSDYDELRQTWINKYRAVPGTEPGDPDRGAEAIVDVVRGEGVAEGKSSWPWCLLLGRDGERDLNTRFAKHQNILSEWGEVTRGVWFDDGQLGL